MASTYVPIESWIYPAIERLALAGYVQTAFAGLRPWTRMESARLVAEAQEQQAEHLDSEEVPDEQMNLIDTGSGASSSQRSYGSGTASVIARPRSTRSTGAALRSPALRLPTATTSRKPSPTIMGGPTARERTSTPASRPARPRATSRLTSALELQRTAPGPVTPSSADAAIAAADFTPTAAAGPDSGFTRGRVLEGLRLLHLSQQPAHLWKASVVVGSGQRRSAAVQQQRRAHHHAPL